MVVRAGSVAALAPGAVLELDLNEDAVRLSFEDGPIDFTRIAVVDAGGRCVIPGFVDSHTHLVFAGSREDEFAMRSGGATYAEIARSGGGILSTVRSVREADVERLVNVPAAEVLAAWPKSLPSRAPARDLS